MYVVWERGLGRPTAENATICPTLHRVETSLYKHGHLQTEEAFSF